VARSPASRPAAHPGRPDSDGASRPSCYGRGGPEPTVTTPTWPSQDRHRALCRRQDRHPSRPGTKVDISATLKECRREGRIGIAEIVDEEQG